MKMKRLGFTLLLFALLTLLPASSRAGEVSMNRIYRHTDLKEVRRATLQVLGNHNFTLVRCNPYRVTFVRKSGHDGKTILTFTFRDKNDSIKVHISGENNGKPGKQDDAKLRKTTERLLDSIRHKIN